MIEWLVNGNTAVITGGASGIGLAAARRLLGSGLNVVIGDADESHLHSAQEALARIDGSGATFHLQRCDVTNPADLQALCDSAYDRFGQVHCLMNNAGAGLPPSLPWENAERWHRQLDINLWGIIYGCQTFIPRMLEQGQAGAIINTGSKQGITNPPGNYAYNLSKAGVKAYTESVAHALRETEGCRLSAHLLIPGFTYTGMIARFIKEQPPSAWSPDEVVEFLIKALEQGDFYVLCPDNDTPRELDARRIQWNTDDLIHNRPALSRWDARFEQAYNSFINESDTS